MVSRFFWGVESEAQTVPDVCVRQGLINSGLRWRGSLPSSPHHTAFGRFTPGGGPVPSVAAIYNGGQMAHRPAGL